MNSKKLLAVLCATAMASSTLVPVMASADEVANLSEPTVLWSDSFDSYTNDAFGAGSMSTTPMLVGSVAGGESYGAIDGLNLQTTSRADDSSYFIAEPVEEGSEDLGIITSISRFATVNRGAKITFTDTSTYNPTDAQSLVFSTRVKINEDETHVYGPIFKIGNIQISNEIMGVENNAWTELKVVYSADGTYAVIANDVPVAAGSGETLSAITFDALDKTGVALVGDNDASKAAAHPYGYHTVSFDDMVVYLTDDVAAPAPEAETKTPQQTPSPEPTDEPTPSPEPKAAPKADVPEGAAKVLEQGFDAEEDVTYSLGTESTVAAIGDITVHIGGRGNGGTTETYATIKENVAGDKILKTGSGRYGNAGRAPYITLNKEVLTSELGADAMAHLTFAAKLSPSTTLTADGAPMFPGTINFYKNNTVDRDLYTSVIATLTTDENATADGSIIVPANEWILVDYIMLADGTLAISVNGEINMLSATHTALPLIGTTNDINSNVVYTSVEFDNILVYVDGEYTPIQPTEEPKIPAVTAPEGANIVANQDMSALEANYSHAIGTEGGTYTDIEGLSYTIGGRSEGVSGASTRVYAIKNTYDDQYLYVQTGRYGTGGRAPIFEVADAPTLAELETDEDFVAVSFAAKLVPSDGNAATLVFPNSTGFNSNGGYYNFIAGILTTGEATSENMYTVPANEWFTVDVVVLKTGDYAISVNGSPVISGKDLAASGGGSEKETLSGLPYITTNSTKNATNAAFALDNVVAYYTGARVVVNTPEPTKEPVSAPGVDVEDNVSVVYSESFNAIEASTTRMATTSAEVPVSDGLKVTLGSRDKDGSTGESSSDPQYTAVSVKENVEGDKVLNLTGGKFGTVTRAAKVAVNDSPDVTTLGETDYVAMGFAFKLNSVNASGQVSALSLVANADDVAKASEGNTETKDDGNVYGYVLATLTTEAESESGIVVSADEWHTAKVYVFNGQWFVYVDGEEAAAGETVNYSNSDKVSITKVPQLVAAKNTKEVVTYSNVDIDNLVVYTSEIPVLANVAITAATAEAATITADVDTTAKVVVASYADGRLVSVATKIVSLTAGENTVEIAAAAGDKVMAWTAYNNQGVQPYCAAVTVQ